MDTCLLFSKSPLYKVTKVPAPHDYKKCAAFHSKLRKLRKCAADLLSFRQGRVDMPKWYSIDYAEEYECFTKPEGTYDVADFTGNCATTWYLDKTSAYQADTPVRAPVHPSPRKTVNQTMTPPSIEIYKDQTIVAADYFWVCGKECLLASLPLGWKTNMHKDKRAYQPDPKVFLDSTGQPRDIPYEFKARDEVKSEFEAIFIWITPNKNTEWINYIYYNQQRCINYTDDALTALGEQLDTTSTTTWQNRQALEWLLADKEGYMYCLVIPPDGAFTKAMLKLKNLRLETTINAGRDKKIWDWLDLSLGKWGAWFAKLGISIVMGGLLFCCLIPILKSLVVKATVRQMEVLRWQDEETLLKNGKDICLNSSHSSKCPYHSSRVFPREC
ncbi:hypothetical protein Q7C36_019960 [Tachysurus vachellii]|uniref:Uncharacterized protein n=1 Tax=Tachysurus vachellii TaxID=175792 RepID=A0AA88LSS2_TACVA|nr:hypothetical protein Q7C36_019960 [Tachysurus vachellii]